MIRAFPRAAVSRSKSAQDRKADKLGKATRCLKQPGHGGPPAVSHAPSSAVQTGSSDAGLHPDVPPAAGRGPSTPPSARTWTEIAPSAELSAHERVRSAPRWLTWTSRPSVGQRPVPLCWWQTLNWSVQMPPANTMGDFTF